MEVKSIIDIGSASIASLGGAALILSAFSAWLGKLWSSRILATEMAKMNEKLEIVKKQNQLEIEQHKSALLLDFEKSKTVFNRFSEAQFKLYCEVWSSLCDVELSCEKLWEEASKGRVNNLSRALAEAKKNINNGSLVLEDGHYMELIRIIDVFDNYQLGKSRLSEVYRHREDFYNDEAIKQMIEKNGAIRSQYMKILSQVRKSFKSQLEGRNEVTP